MDVIGAATLTQLLLELLARPGLRRHSSISMPS
jgi:hypothetical protein